LQDAGGLTVAGFSLEHYVSVAGADVLAAKYTLTDAIIGAAADVTTGGADNLATYAEPFQTYDTFAYDTEKGDIRFNVKVP